MLVLIHNVFKYWIIMLHTWNEYNVACQLHLNNINKAFILFKSEGHFFLLSQQSLANPDYPSDVTVLIP